MGGPGGRWAMCNGQRAMGNGQWATDVALPPPYYIVYTDLRTNPYQSITVVSAVDFCYTLMNFHDYWPTFESWGSVKGGWNLGW